MLWTLVFLGIMTVAMVGWLVTLWLLAKRSFALVDIALNGHLSGQTLAKMAHEALGKTGAQHFKKPYKDVS